MKRIFTWLVEKTINRDIELSYKVAGTFGYSEYAFLTPTKESVIYSFGVGEDISFDKTLIEKYDARVFAFDFTPWAIKHIKDNPVEGLQFYPYGVASKDGFLTFYAPYQAKNVSWSSVPRATEKQMFPVKRLSTIMQELGHTHIDILKMDIEGAEYEVLEDMLASGIRPTQLLVEFQHRFKGLGIMKTKRAIRLLKRAGYKMFFASKDKTEFSFLLV